jgi:dipeptidyl-peptidase-3
MKSRIFPVIAVIIMTCLPSCQQYENFDAGDFLFQDLDCELCESIENVTFGYNGYNFSHVGIVTRKNNRLFVLEAAENGVVQTPLQVFLDRSPDADGNPKVLQMRLRDEYRKYVPDIISQLEKYLGYPYDTLFLPDNDAFYCSELLYKAADDAMSRQNAFYLQPMTYIDPATGKTDPVWEQYFRRMNVPVPENIPGINPGLASRSDALAPVAVLGNISLKKNQKMDYTVDKFSDLQILRYEVNGFDGLTLSQKTLLYYLSQAALEGRDILFDQNCRYNMVIRRTLEAVYEHYLGDRTSEGWADLEAYLKRVWFSNGIHHHYGEEKFLPSCSQDYFISVVNDIPASKLPLSGGQTVKDLLDELLPVMFDPAVLPKKVNQAQGEDLLLTSANNYYFGISQPEAEKFYADLKASGENHPVSYGLNSRLTGKNGNPEEEIWKIGGMYSPAIEKIVFWLEKAAGVAENDRQKAVIEKLISYYRTGDLKEFDEYSILWVEDTESRIDFVNGFIETYGDPLGIKASWESVVNFKNIEASRRTEIISGNAQWFEDNSPVDSRFKKEQVKGVTAKVITVTMLGGDCYPATPIGINLPNSNWIRKEHGSKSVTIENIMEAYDKSSQGSGFAEEFYWSDAERELIRKYGFLTDNLHTDLHECLGHGSGKMLPGVPNDALKAYGATIEETRADLFGLYYLADPKLVELGLAPDMEAYKAEYYKFMCNGLMTQLTRIEPGRQIEESHMRNRALIARWVYRKGQGENVIELKKRDGKTFVVINDYSKLRSLFGELLKEVQRIKSEGDYRTAGELVEKYAVQVDPKLHAEILDRYKKLNIAPYKGFVNPVFSPVIDAAGNITDIKLEYTESYARQMMRYSRNHSWL